MMRVFNFPCPFTFIYFIRFQIAAREMTRSDVTLYARKWNSPVPLARNTGLYPPNNPVGYRICGLTQERVYIVQERVRDTSRCDKRLKAVPHWRIGQA